MTIEHISRETRYIDLPEISSFGQEEELEPQEAESIGGIICNPPLISPLESAVLSSRSDEDCYSALSTLEIQARLLARDHVLTPSWGLDANGEVRSE